MYDIRSVNKIQDPLSSGFFFPIFKDGSPPTVNPLPLVYFVVSNRLMCHQSSTIHETSLDSVPVPTPDSPTYIYSRDITPVPFRVETVTSPLVFFRSLARYVTLLPTSSVSLVTFPSLQSRMNYPLLLSSLHLSTVSRSLPSNLLHQCLR